MIFESTRDNKLFRGLGDNVCAPHFHKSVEIMCVLSGIKRTVINGETVILCAGDVVFCMPFDVHEYFPSEGEQLCFAFPPEYCEEFYAFTKGRRLKNNKIEKSGVTESLLAQMNKIGEIKNPVYMRGAINCILGEVIEACEFTQAKNEGENLLRAILEYIDLNFNKELTLSSAAAHFGYSKYYFSRLFNASFSCNFSAYLNQVRIHKSFSLLKTEKISSVWHRCGFNSPQQFYLNFRKVTGMTPREFSLSRGNGR